jgi:hypothetical protein
VTDCKSQVLAAGDDYRIDPDHLTCMLNNGRRCCPG